jgi:hypothetical protein
MTNSSPQRSPFTEHRLQLVVAANETLIQLMKVKELAFANGRFEEWCGLYTQGYILRLRAMR